MKLACRRNSTSQSRKSGQIGNSSFERLRCTTKHNAEGEVLQISVLIYTMGKEVEHILKAFTFPEGGDEEKYVKVIEKFDHRSLHFGDISID